MSGNIKLEIPEPNWDDLITELHKKISPDELVVRVDDKKEITEIQIAINRNNPKYLVGIESEYVREIVIIANEHNVFYDIILTPFIFAVRFVNLK